MYRAERGLFELRRGRALYVRSAAADQATEEGAVLASVEGLGRETLERFRWLGAGYVRLVVTEHRARVLGLSPSGNTRAWSLNLNGESPTEIMRLSSAVAVRPTAPCDVREASAAEAAGLALVRLGTLLPAVVSVPADLARAGALSGWLADAGVLDVTSAEIEAMVGRPQVEVTYVSDAPVPLAEAEDARFVIFTETNGLLEHVAILIGQRQDWPDPIPVRLHSACLTGDLFGSLRCDCGEQLRGTLRLFNARKGGVLLYLAQEGRAIGLGNKFRAYALQDEGLDTIDADCTLGFGADERRYDAAVQILRKLGIERVQLVTNNPDKMRALEEGGIHVAARLPLHGRINRHNLTYVRAKVHRAGHWLGEMLAGAGDQNDTASR